MKRKTIILGVLLAVLLAMPASAAGTSLSISVPEILPDVGETFSVVVEISGNPGLCAAQYTLVYDDTLLTCENAQAGEVLSGALSVVNPNASDGAIVAAVAIAPVTGDGSIGVFTFRVLKGGDVSFALKDGVFSDANGETVATNVPVAAAGQASGATDPAGTDTIPARTDTSVTDHLSSETSTPADGGINGTEHRTFLDVPATHWACGEVERAAQLGYVTGVGNDLFEPDRELTRAEFVTMLWRMAGKPEASAAASFTDVPADIWYRDAVNWAAEQGYVKGTGAAVFSPDGKLTRQEAVTILFRYHGGQSGMETLLTLAYDSQSSDSGDIADWAKSAMYWAIYNEIMNGTSETTVSPAGTATRAQVAAILVRYSM